jgi:AcrR family transcriptional regulator
MATCDARLRGRRAGIDEHGPGTLSLREVARRAGVSGVLSPREVARRAGVSRAAPTHHFGDQAGLLTRAAVQGYELLDAALTAAAYTGDFAELAITPPPHTDVSELARAVAHRLHADDRPRQ